MLDAHAHVMQVKLCKANTRGVTQPHKGIKQVWLIKESASVPTSLGMDVPSSSKK